MHSQLQMPNLVAESQLLWSDASRRLEYAVQTSRWP